MFIESLNAILKAKKGKAPPARGKRGLVHKLPFKMRFKASKLYVSVIPVLVLGVLVPGRTDELNMTWALEPARPD